MKTRTVGILLFPGFEPLDAFGPVEAFVIARFPGQESDEPPYPFGVLTVAETALAVPMTGGLRVVPDVTLTECPPLDVLLVPGGAGARRECRNTVLLHFVRERAAEVEVLASVCTGAALLGAAGLLGGCAATTNRRAFEWVASLAPGARWDPDVRWVDTGRM